MAGTKSSWTPERRARQAEATRKQMADPERRRRQAEIMRAVRLNPEHQAAWLEARRKPERRAVDSATMTRLRRDADFEAVRAAARIAATTRVDRSFLAEREQIRSAPVPDGYQDVYDYLLTALRLSAEEAKEIVHQQRQADMRAS